MNNLFHLISVINGQKRGEKNERDLERAKVNGEKLEYREIQRPDGKANN